MTTKAVKRILKNSGIFFIAILLFSQLIKAQSIPKKIDSLERIIATKKLSQNQRVDTQLTLLYWLRFKSKALKNAESLWKEVKDLPDHVGNDKSKTYADLYFVNILIKSSDYARAKSILNNLEKKVDSINNKELKRLYVIEKASLLTKNEGNYQSAEKLLKDLVQKLKEDNGNVKFRIYKDLSYIYYITGKAKQSLENAKKALKLAKEPLQKADAYNHMALAFMRSNKNSDAVSYLNSAIQINESYQNKKALVFNYMNLGICYGKVGLFLNAEQYYKKSYQLAKSLDLKEAMLTVQINRSSLLCDTGKFKKALKTILDAKNTMTQISKNHRYSIYVYMITADIYLKLENLDKAEKYIQLAQEVNQDLESTNTLLLTAKATLYKKQGFYNKALENIALVIKNETNTSEFLLNAYRIQSECYEKKGDLKKAIASNQKFRETYQEFVNNLNDNRFATLKRLHELELEKHKVQQEKELQAQKLQNQKNLSKGLGVILLLLVLSGLIYYMYTQKKRSDRIVEEQKEELSRYNENSVKLLSLLKQDLKKPIGLLKKFTSLMVNNHTKNKDSLKHISAIMGEINSLQISLENTLNIANSRMNDETLAKDNYSLKFLVQYCIRDLEAPKELKKIKTVVNIDEDLEVHVNKDLLLIVLKNVTNNAIKFSKEETTIQFFSKKYENSCQLIIQDTDEAIRPEKLTVCRDVLEKNNGTIKIEEVPNKGKRTVITLPYANGFAMKSV